MTKWKTVKLSDVAYQVADRVDNPLTSGYDRFVGLDHFVSGEFRISKWGTTNDLISAMKLFNAGDTLFARRNAYLKRVSMVDFDGICSGDAIVLRNNERLIDGFLPLILNTDRFWEHAIANAAGSMSKRVRVEDLMKYEFPLPPVDEQRRIADLLWAADDSITEWQETISRLEKLLAAVREDILCNKDLPRQKLKTCVKSITAGKSVLAFGKPAAENEFGVLKVSAVGADGFIADENKTLEETAAFIRAFSVHANDLLITRVNTRELVGRVCKVPQDYPNLMLSDKSLRLEVDEENGDKDFLLQVLRSREVRSQIEATASGTGGAMKNISQVQILNFSLPLPNIETQRQLASKANEIERSLEQTRLHIKKSIELKKRLLSEILSTQEKAYVQ